MPIKFTVLPEDGYYRSQYIGKVTVAEMIAAYGEFFQGTEWIPGFGELIDLSDVDAEYMTTDGLKRVADFLGPIVQQNNIYPLAAVYAPMDLPYGLARFYAVMAQEFASLQVFRNMQDAVNFLKSETHSNDG